MKPFTVVPQENTLSAGEIKVLQNIVAGMDGWTDRICERTDELLKACGFTPVASVDPVLNKRTA
jgi:hypothetical protein